jgi:hypothetical protein
LAWPFLKITTFEMNVDPFPAVAPSGLSPTTIWWIWSMVALTSACEEVPTSPQLEL